MFRTASRLLFPAFNRVIQSSQKRDVLKPTERFADEYQLVDAVLFDLKKPVTHCLFWCFLNSGHRCWEQAALLHRLCYPPAIRLPGR